MKYKIKSPIGVTVTPKEIMTEEELRAFVVQLVQDPEQHETWKEKAAKDPIDEVIAWLTQADFIIEKI